MQSLLMVLIGAGCFMVAGCGSETKPILVHGTVVVGSQRPDSGEVRFIPIDGTSGSTNAGVIVNGEYRIEGRGGVPVGEYRIEIVAKKKTGRTVTEYNGFEMATVDEAAVISPPIYAGNKSPLTQKISSSDDGKVDFSLPAE